MVSVSAWAADFHVSPFGSDSADGSRERPWRSIQHGIDQISPGDTLLVESGSYKPFHIDRWDTSREARITVRAVGGKVSITGYGVYDDRYTAISVLTSYVTIEGFDIDVGAVSAGLRSRGIRVSGEEGDHVRGVHILRNRIRNAGWVGITTSYADDVLIDGNTVWGSKEEHGIYVANSADNPMIVNNTVFLNPEAGIQINGDPELGGDGIITGALVAGNRIYLNGSAGSAALNLASVRDSVFMNNLIYDNQSQGIASWDDEGGEEYGCKNNLYINNTVIMPPGSRHVFSLRHGSTGNRVLNNIFVHLGGKDSLAVDRASIAGLRSDYNIVTRIEDTAGRLVTLESWQQQTGQDAHSLVATAAEVFRDAASHDYSLREGSPAIGRGVAVEILGKDITGAVREGPRPDIGAYRYQPRVPAGDR